MSKKQGKSLWDEIKDSAKKPFLAKKKKVKAAPEQRREAGGASGDVACEGPSTSKQGHHDLQGPGQSGVSGSCSHGDAKASGSSKEVDHHQGPKHGGASMCLPGNTKASGPSNEVHHDQGPKLGGASIRLHGDVEASCVRNQDHHDQGTAATMTSMDEKTNYARLCCLLVSVGSQVLRDTFDRIIPPSDLKRILKRNPAHSTLQSLQKQGIVSSAQWSKLYPAIPSSVSSTGFSPALLIVLLRTICKLSPPPAGWDAPPHSEDTSCEADISRVKYFMNVVSGQLREASVSDAMFSEYWQQIRDTLVRLGGAGYEDLIDETKNQEMDSLDEEHFIELLKQWKEIEDTIKVKLNELESVMRSSEEEVASSSCVSSTQAKCGMSHSATQAFQPSEDMTGNNAGLDPGFTYQRERTNYARLCQLLVSVGSQVLRQIFDTIIPPQNLRNVLTRDPAHSKLQSLRKERIVNSMQWSKLYPASPSSVSSTGFSPALLIVLLRTICKLSPPLAGWDAPPHSADTSREADIARVNYFMNAVFDQARGTSLSDAMFSEYWQQIRDTLMRLGGAEDVIDEMKNQEVNSLDEEHFIELLKQWKDDEDTIKVKLNELESVMRSSGEEDVSHPAQIIEGIRQHYRTCEERVLPVPWCEDFSFHLNDIFTRLKIVSKEKSRGTLTDEITNLTGIFRAHKECQKPRTILIEGDPGMGKTTYCQKLAYDWANQQGEWDESFPEIEVLLLLKCHDIKSDIWEAIDDQLLPDDVDEDVRRSFFKFIRENQSKVLLVLDGLDEADSSIPEMYFNLVKGKVLLDCHIVLTSRHEAGRKVRQYCDTLWEIVGFAKSDAESFIHKYFKNMEHLSVKLLQELRSDRPEHREIIDLTTNPLNTALLCILCEDYKGVLPNNKTQLYIEIVRLVLKRYEIKVGLSSNGDDPITVYRKELIQLGRMALHSLRKGELFIEEQKFGSNSSVLTKFGFLSIQTGGSKRKPSLRYRFSHKTFQEFFAGFYLAFLIINEEIDRDSVVTDEFKSELKQVFLFMSGIVALQCEETAVSLVKSIATHINLRNDTTDHEFVISKCVTFAFDCILECKTHKRNLQSHLIDAFGRSLALKTLKLWPYSGNYLYLLAEILQFNTGLADLGFHWNKIGASGAAAISEALKVNTCLTNLDLQNNGIGASGAGAISEALKVNTCLTNLDLQNNGIGDSGAAAISEALKVNTCLTYLNLRWNEIGASGTAATSEALKVNTCLTNLDLDENKIGASGAAAISEALKVNTCLTNLDLTNNGIRASGAAAISEALKVNTCLTNLNLYKNEIGDSGAAAISEALKVNTCLTNLNLYKNEIGDSGAAAISEALKVNTCLTNLGLNENEIGDSGAAAISEALKVNTCLTNLGLRWNKIGASGAAAISEACRVNTLVEMDFDEYFHDDDDSDSDCDVDVYEETSFDCV